MAKSKIYVGLEIGTSKTCVVVGEVKADSSVKILGVGETKSVGIRKGEISDMALVKECVRTALIEAEDVSDVDIRSVFLSVTGSHIEGVNNRGTYRLPDEDQEITQEHMEEAEDIARDIAIPSDNVPLHNIERQYLIDGSYQASNPIGLLGRTLDADFHIVHGVKTRILNSIKCAREISLDVDDVVFAPIASARIALNPQDKEAGSLVIDIGGGTTDYVLYIDGAVVASGCIPVGGDHVTNDIHLVTQMPLSKAEKVKCAEGDVSGDKARSVGIVVIPDEKGFPQLEIKRELLNDIIRGRLEETLQLVKQKLPDGALEKVQTGVFLTGGTSLMRGFGELANDVFNLPIYKPEQPEVSGVYKYFRDPQYSTTVGLIFYALLRDEDRPIKKKGIFSRVVKAVFPF